MAALGTPYGQIFAVKVILFVALLALAALNRYRLTPALQTGTLRAGTQLRLSIRLEALVVLAILATTATVTTVAAPGMELGCAERQTVPLHPARPA